MAEDFRLETPEAISVAYDIAGIGTRFLAQIIDAVAIIGIGSVVGGGVFLLVAFGALGQTVAVILILVFDFLVLFGYFPLYETFWSGQTPGKRALQVRVIKLSGYPIGFVDSVIRNLVRVVDFLPSFYGVGIIVMFVSTQSRRLGDFAAGTIVVKERDPFLPERSRTAGDQSQGPPVAPIGELDPDELSWNLHALTSRDLVVIGEFLERAPSLPEDARYRIGNELASYVAERIGARLPLRPDHFLERVRALY